MAAVAAGHKETAQACAETLRSGGNAFDAVLSGFFVACTAEPVLNSLAGGGFLMAAENGSKPEIFDFFCQTPARRQHSEVDFYAIDGNFGDDVQEFHVGMGACAVPGAIKGIDAIHRALCRMPLTTIAEQGIKLAREGVALNDFQSYVLQILEPILGATKEVQALFHQEGRLKRAGDRYGSSALADAMDAISREGERLFYQGEIARSLVSASDQHGGHLQMQDLGKYEVLRRRPLETAFRGTRIWTNPVPSLGGSLFAHGLEILDRVWAQSAERYPALLARVLAATSLARATSDLDQEADQAAVDAFLNHTHLTNIANTVRKHHLALKGTTHISVVDNQGNFAAMSLSNGEGNTRTIPGTDILLNNMLGEEDLSPMGLGQWRPGRRLSSMMAPSLMRMDDACYALGSGGSNRIRSALLQVISNVAGLGLRLRAAIDASRMHYEKGVLHLEPGFSELQFDGLRDQIKSIKPWRAQNLFFGGVHAVCGPRNGPAYAAADKRRGGHSIENI